MAAPIMEASASVNMTSAHQKVKDKKAALAWTQVRDDHPLSHFAAQLEEVLAQADYNEMYGVQLELPKDGNPAPHTTLVILQKFLRANESDVSKAKAQLLEALKWRKAYNPLAVKDEVFSKDLYGGLGYVKEVSGVHQTVAKTNIACFNIYGPMATDMDKTFGDIDAFVRWRVALMELTLEMLDLPHADKMIPDHDKSGADPYTAIQVHDYDSVSYFRQSSEIKSASSQIVDVFNKYYPEAVSLKYFVNVPTLMQWMNGSTKRLMCNGTLNKTTWLKHGKDLQSYIARGLPPQYGGEDGPLEHSATTTKYDDGAGGLDEKKKGPTESIAESKTSEQLPAYTSGSAAPEIIKNGAGGSKADVA